MAPAESNSFSGLLPDCYFASGMLLLKTAVKLTRLRNEGENPLGRRQIAAP